MKKRLVMALLAGVMMLSSAVPVFAAPKKMADGGVFDAEYYAAHNPDVAAAFGTDESALCMHYINNGKAEGRKPCEDGAVADVNFHGYAITGNVILEYDEEGNAVIGITPEGDKIVCDNNGNVYAKSQQTKPVQDTRLGQYVDHKRGITYVLPYIIDGVDIRSGDVDGDGDNDNNGNTWYEGQIWTASNGYVLRIADQYYVKPGALNSYDAIFRTGEDNKEPGGPYAMAAAEYLGRTSIVSISPNGLPQVNTVSSKQTSINVNDPSLLAYKAGFDPLWKKQNKGSMSELVISSNSIGLLDATNGIFYMWDITYDASRGDWAFRVIGSYTKLGWDAVKNSIRMITPDADAVFDAIYQSCYYGHPDLPGKKYQESKWINIGSTQLKKDWTTGTLYFRFK